MRKEKQKHLGMDRLQIIPTTQGTQTQSDLHVVYNLLSTQAIWTHIKQLKHSQNSALMDTPDLLLSVKRYLPTCILVSRRY